MCAEDARQQGEPDPDGARGIPDGAVPETTDRLGFGDLLLERESMRSVLQKVAERGVEIVPGAVEGSVTVVERGQPMSASWTGLLAFELDEVQFGVDVGPCVEAAVSGHVNHVSDMRTERRWPWFTELAVRQGALSSLSTPIPVEHDLQAALNLYGTDPHVFDDEGTRSIAGSIAGRAAVAIANMRSYDRTRRTVSDLEAAMSSRAAIEQAKGILMAQQGVDAEEAFAMLARASQRQNRKLRDVAGDLVAGVRRSVGGGSGPEATP